MALRILHSIANQAPAERAFSQMNMIHNKLRNRLGNEKTNVLIYIRINEQVLRRKDTQTKRLRLPPRELQQQTQQEQEEEDADDVVARGLDYGNDRKDSDRRGELGANNNKSPSTRVSGGSTTPATARHRQS
ncbi:uncharacterized protein Z518_06113 [Rhinocladiella mackenziei CBS 650.93]|uniref:HAT C-terminal dimerisation domain-containing protein n=1 Tax=Rhinocladiella mackenziei CBS 650.93 TaxID=1442369 RepID=A0A0D2IPX7_9EURO|nr:uncharacterized protein Z518_06113 [Rhinocladiella mackenziei CBS 650.93]KIX05241.1 hypothetical protein Z518_06113 [Rhinocladiella mackenziei CBS 650.93]